MRLVWLVVFLGFLAFPAHAADPATSDGLASLKAKAGQEDAQSQRQLGVVYANGVDVPRDYAEAAKWFRKAADQGDATAQFQLGGLYYQGFGLTQDYAETAKWIRKAADQGNIPAQGVLGGLFGAGQGVPQNYEEAYFWLTLASTSGEKTIVAPRDYFQSLLTPQQVSAIQTRARDWKPTPAHHPAK